MAARALASPMPAPIKAMAAEHMRANPTATEDCLRLALQKRIAFAVEPQVNILGWTVDLYIRAARFVIEVDGGSHVGREPKDARRDEQMRAERYIVFRVAASDVEKDVDAVVRRVEAQLPADACEEKERLDQEAAVLLAEERALEIVDQAQSAASLGRVARPVRAQAYPYICTACGNTFRSAEKPMPDCRRCQSARHVRVACRCGAVAVRGKYRCSDCDVANEAAGPGARAYTGQMPHHAKRGRKL